MSDPMTPDDAGDTAPAKDNASRNNQPSIMNIKTMPTNSLMRVESDVLEPLTFSQSEAVWELQPKGFLHPNSAIEIGMAVGGATRAFPYLNVGVHSLVRRAVLRTNAGRVINDTDDWNNLQSVNSMFLNNSSNKEREQYMSGRQMDFCVTYAEGTDVSTTDRATVAAGEGGYSVCNNLDLCEIAPITLAGGGSQGQNVQSHLLNTSESTYQIKLHELFPYFKAGNQMPLFLLPNERIQVVLYWAETLGTNRLCISQADETAARIDEIISLTQGKCKFIADYTFYDGELMDKFRQDYEKGMRFNYTDTRLSKQTVIVADAVSNVRNVGGNGMLVDSVVWNYQTPGSELNLIGAFNASAPSVVGVSRELLTSNLFINSEFLFPQSVTNPARHFHNLKESTQSVPFITRQCYSGQGIEGLVSGVTTHAFEGRNQAAELGGEFFHQGFRTSGLGRRIDNSGIRLHSSCVLPANSTQRAWLDIKRYLVISDGHLETYYL